MKKIPFIILTALFVFLCSCTQRPQQWQTPVAQQEEEVNTFDTTVPEGYDVRRDNVSYGETREFTYHSTVLGRDKHALIILPPEYDATQTYKVLVLFAGLGQDHLFWENELSASVILGNLIADGALTPCLTVCVNHFFNDTEAFESSLKLFEHDKSPKDVAECLLPALANSYNIAQGKENTAVAGLSAGGREALNLSLTYNCVDYVCAIEPFYYDEKTCILCDKSFRKFIVFDGAFDGVVLDTPYKAHLDLLRYRVAHDYITLNYSHEPDCWKNGLYLFAKGIF